MARDYLAKSVNEVRRKDRAVDSEEWIRDFLHKAAFGALAMVYEEQPYINSNIFVYDEAAGAIFIHTAREGKTRAVLEKNDKVCFNVSELGRILPAKEALEFSLEYASVMVFGKGSIVDEEAEASAALQKMLDKYAPHLKPGRDYRGVVPEELKRTTVFRVDIEHWSAKKKKVEEDFPGAFYYGA